MVANYKKLQKQLIALKKFQEVAKAIRFVAGGEIGLLRKEIKCRFLALSSVAPFFNQSYYTLDAKSFLVVPITDDRGSCGSHNNNVVNAGHELVNYLEEQEKNILIYTIGKKAKVYFKKLYKKYLMGFALNLRDVKFSIDACYFLVQKLMRFKFDRCYLVFNRYFSIQMQKALAYNVGSIAEFYQVINNRFNVGDKTSTFFKSIKSKATHTDFMMDLYTFSFALFLCDALEDNKYSFLAGRFNGMDNVIKSTTDLIEALTLKYNKARQEYITTELIEIISCKEAIMSTTDSVNLIEHRTIDLFLGYDDLLLDLLLGDLAEEDKVAIQLNVIKKDWNDMNSIVKIDEDTSKMNWINYVLLRSNHLIED
jgi:ATP synthase F1 gamma subunit